MREQGTAQAEAVGQQGAGIAQSGSQAVSHMVVQPESVQQVSAQQEDPVRQQGAAHP